MVPLSISFMDSLWIVGFAEFGHECTYDWCRPNTWCRVMRAQTKSPSFSEKMCIILMIMKGDVLE